MNRIKSKSPWSKLDMVTRKGFMAPRWVAEGGREGVRFRRKPLMRLSCLLTPRFQSQRQINECNGDELLMKSKTVMQVFEHPRTLRKWYFPTKRLKAEISTIPDILFISAHFKESYKFVNINTPKSRVLHCHNWVKKTIHVRATIFFTGWSIWPNTYTVTTWPDWSPCKLIVNMVWWTRLMLSHFCRGCWWQFVVQRQIRLIQVMLLVEIQYWTIPGVGFEGIDPFLCDWGRFHYFLWCDMNWLQVFNHWLIG